MILKKIENLFLILAMIFGLLYVFITPPFQNVDESNHYYRVLGIVSNTDIVKINNRVGVMLPAKYSEYVSQYNYLIKDINEKVKSFNSDTDNNDLVFSDISNTVLYSPVSYLGILPGGYLGKLIGITPHDIIYLLRFCNLLTYVFLGYLAIKNIPFAKLPMSILLLTPMSLSVGAAVSSDVMVIGLNFLWIAFILKCYYCKKINYKNITFLGVLLILICLAKCYFMLVFLVFLLPKEKFNNEKIYYSTMFGFLLLGLLVSFLWYEIIKDYVIPLNNSANPYLQLEYIGNNLGMFALVLLKTFFVKLGRILITMIGVLGYQDVRLDFITYFVYPVIFYFASKSDIDKSLYSMSKKCKWLMIFILLFSIIIVFTYMYLSWSPVGANIITGINGKYFLPVMPLLAILLSFGKNHFNIEYKTIQKLCFILILICLASSELSLLHRFYGLTPNLYYNI